MTEKQNELTTTQPIVEEVVQETDKYVIVKTLDGKFRKDMKYKKYYSKVPENEEDMIHLFKVLNDQDNDLVTPMKYAMNKEIEIHQVYTNPYQSFDEETGGTTNGVTTTIFNGEDYIATSSKAVYHTIMGLFETFGYPNTENYRPIKVQVFGKQMENGEQINLRLIGF